MSRNKRAISGQKFRTLISPSPYCIQTDITEKNHKKFGRKIFLKCILPLVYVLLKTSLKNFEHNIASMWNEWHCMAIWIFFGIAFLQDWNENWPFPFLSGYCWVFQICWHTECSILAAASFRILGLWKGLLVKAMVFPVVIYRCESWTIKKAEHQRPDALKLWCWRRLLRVLWTASRSNKSTLKESTLNIHWKDWW